MSMPTPPPPAPVTGDPARGAAAIERAMTLGAAIRTEIGRVIVGQDRMVGDVLACLFAGGHVLLEGVPGLGKTVLLKTLAQAVRLQFSRVQCTPDLMPADILGTTILTGTRAGEFQAGPVFTNLLLADEVNRATPKTQAALLEAMAEHAVTLGGATRDLPDPFLVLATQNPIDMEGTYPLPEAQMDRFLAKVVVPMPPAEDLVEILTRTTGTAHHEVRPVASAQDVLGVIALTRQVPIAPHVAHHAARLVTATHPDHPDAAPGIRRYARLGASPRGAQAIVLLAKATALLAGRAHVAVEDVRAVAPAALRHRIVLGYEAATAGIDADALVAEVLQVVGPPDPPVRGA